MFKLNKHWSLNFKIKRTMKKLFVALFVMLCALQGNAQNIFFRTSSSIEGSTPKQINFAETVYWQRRFNRESQPKTAYYFVSIYKLDSVVGVQIYGLDIDMMSDKFDKRRANSFRYWNKMRMGFSLMLEANPRHFPLPIETAYEYINAELYFSYLHLPRLSRGDRMTKSRRGSFVVFLSATPSQRFEGYLKFKPLGRAWIKSYFKQEYSIRHVSLCAEIELNSRGFDKTKTESSKDLYRGFTIFVGPEYNLNANSVSFHLGIKYEGRNH